MLLDGARRGLSRKRVTTRQTIPARRNCAPRKGRSRQMALPLRVQTRMNSARNFAMPRDAECTSTLRDSNVMVNFGPNAWLRGWKNNCRANLLSKDVMSYARDGSRQE